MTDFSGTFTAKTESQTTVNGPDNHQLGLAVTYGPQTTADANWKGAMLTQWGTSDTVDGHGKIHGHFRNVHPNGDTDYGTSECTVTKSGTEAHMKGTWRFVGGTGRFAKISGHGVFTGKQTSPNDSHGEWSGSYNLG